MCWSSTYTDTRTIEICDGRKDFHKLVLSRDLFFHLFVFRIFSPKALLPEDDREGFVQGATGSSVVSQMFGLPLGGSRIHTCGHSFSCNLRNLGASDMRTWVRPLILASFASPAMPRGQEIVSRMVAAVFPSCLACRTSSACGFCFFEVPGKQVLMRVPLCIYGCLGSWESFIPPSMEMGVFTTPCWNTAI